MILSFGYFAFVAFVGAMLLFLFSEALQAQGVPLHNDSIPTNNLKTSIVTDTTKKFVDTTMRTLEKTLKSFSVKTPAVKKDSLWKQKMANPYKSAVKFNSPFFHLDGGYLGYNYNYQSTTDTPYAEKNISQNTLNGSINFSIERYLPFIANFYITRNNSIYFRNITDVQIVFNTALFRNQLAGAMAEARTMISDSLAKNQLEKAYALKRFQLADLKGWLQNPFQLQKLIQANEILKIPQKSYDPSLPDSVNRKRADSLQRLAKAFLQKYEDARKQIAAIEHAEDSITGAYQNLKSLVGRYKSITGGSGSHNTDLLNKMEDSMKRAGVQFETVPNQYSWLQNMRNFSVGKTPVNYTELTAKNINVTGLNIEYDSKYYLAFCGGLIDYRFNDPVVNNSNKVKQYMYMVRAGIGKVENDHLILSIYQGRKQLFTAADSTGSIASIPITGISAETRFNLNPNSYLIAEVAQSFSPDFHSSPAKQVTGFNFSDHTNQGISLKAYGYIPVTGTRLEGMYKYTGSNFQSFSFYQTDAALKSWYIKADQYFWNRKLRLTASVRTADFSNPYIVQNYSGNTVFTSINASFRSKGLPSISVGYMPMSQLTVVGTQIIENRFQTLTANVSDYYKIGSIRASSTAVFTKFFNNGSDTSFVFYDATNILIQQTLFFKDFTGSLNFSRSASTRYTMNVVGEEVNFPISKRGSVGIGFKLNNYNTTENKIGQLLNFNFQLSSTDYISVSAERGYLPGTSGMLVHNDFGNVQFIKRFGKGLSIF